MNAGYYGPSHSNLVVNLVDEDAELPEVELTLCAKDGDATDIILNQNQLRDLHTRLGELLTKFKSTSPALIQEL